MFKDKRVIKRSIYIYVALIVCQQIIKMISASEKIRNAILTVLIIVGAKVVQWIIECVQVLAEIVKKL